MGFVLWQWRIFWVRATPRLSKGGLGVKNFRLGFSFSWKFAKYCVDRHTFEDITILERGELTS